MVLEVQPNPWWIGTLQLYINCPSAGLNHVYIGQNELTGSPLGQFSTFAQTLPANVLAAIATDHVDFSIEYALNVNQTTDAWRLDNLRKLP